MLIRITKRADGASVLVCVRADGSECWQRHEKRRAAHFPLHDLTHFAVETTLGTEHAFFGLVASGWEFEDTTGKGARGPIPPEAILVEHIVGLLDVERATNARWDAAYVVEQLELAAVRMSTEMSARLTDEMIDSIRARRNELLSRWQAVAPGGTLEVAYLVPESR